MRGRFLGSYDVWGCLRPAPSLTHASHRYVALMTLLLACATRARDARVRTRCAGAHAVLSACADWSTLPPPPSARARSVCYNHVPRGYRRSTASARGGSRALAQGAESVWQGDVSARCPSGTRSASAVTSPVPGNARQAAAHTAAEALPQPALYYRVPVPLAGRETALRRSCAILPRIPV